MNRIAVVFTTACLATSAFAAKAPKQVASPPATPPSPATPYDFRGAQLGMPLVEFKALPFPDAGPVAEKHYGAEAAAGIVVMCSDGDDSDYARRVYLNADLKRAGVVKCVYKVPPWVGSHSWSEAYVTVGNSWSDDVMYLFIPDDEGVSRLCDVVITINNRDYEALTVALVTKLGKPTRTGEEDLQNGMGNHFKSAVLTWDNGVSVVRFQQRYGKISDMQLTFEHRALARVFDVRVDAAKGPPKL